MAADESAATNTNPYGASRPNLPPVLRASEPLESGQITLPGPVSLKIASIAPESHQAERRDKHQLGIEAPPLVAAAPARPDPRSEIGREVAAYCQKQIAHWNESDARKLLGEPKRHRPAYDENKVVNGTIYAFDDPTGKYRELELDFDLRSGTLRTVFVYPPRLNWEECRRLWNGSVAAADAPQGRKFYSYTNRRLDVLVDPAGRVISLGWY